MLVSYYENAMTMRCIVCITLWGIYKSVVTIDVHDHVDLLTPFGTMNNYTQLHEHNIRCCVRIYAICFMTFCVTQRTLAGIYIMSRENIIFLRHSLLVVWRCVWRTVLLNVDFSFVAFFRTNRNVVWKCNDVAMHRLRWTVDENERPFWQQMSMIKCMSWPYFANKSRWTSETKAYALLCLHSDNTFHARLSQTTSSR